MLYGHFNPYGRLPYTIAKDAADYSAQLVTGGRANDILSIPYTEGLNIDYRHFDAVSSWSSHGYRVSRSLFLGKYHPSIRVWFRTELYHIQVF